MYNKYNCGDAAALLRRSGAVAAHSGGFPAQNKCRHGFRGALHRGEFRRMGGAVYFGAAAKR